MLEFLNKVKRNLKRHSFNALRKTCSKCGFHIVPKHFYQPIPLDEDVSGNFFSKTPQMIGVDLNEQYSLNLLDKIFPLYLSEFRQLFPNEPSPDSKHSGDFFLINGGFMAIDAHVYYTFIRHFKPRHIIEIGGGNSSILAKVACQKNLEFDETISKLTVIEPYPSKRLRQRLAHNSELLVSKVQEVSLDLFENLGAGDILFIDSSHVLRAGGDVQFEYLEILPRLAPGVLVHIHDISLPKTYPPFYFDNGLFWNEQYLLQAFLAFNKQFEVMWPGNYMMINYPEIVCKVFPEYHLMRKHFPQSEPTSFWIRVKS